MLPARGDISPGHSCLHRILTIRRKSQCPLYHSNNFSNRGSETALGLTNVFQGPDVAAGPVVRNDAAAERLVDLNIDCDFTNGAGFCGACAGSWQALSNCSDFAAPKTPVPNSVPCDGFQITATLGDTRIGLLVKGYDVETTPRSSPQKRADPYFQGYQTAGLQPQKENETAPLDG